MHRIGSLQRKHLDKIKIYNTTLGYKIKYQSYKIYFYPIIIAWFYFFYY